MFFLSVPHRWLGSPGSQSDILLFISMGTGSLIWTRRFLRVVTGRNWVLMSRGLSTLLMASDVPLIYGMVIVAL